MSQGKGFNLIYSKYVQKDEIRTTGSGRDMALISMKKKTFYPDRQQCTSAALGGGDCSVTAEGGQVPGET